MEYPPTLAQKAGAAILAVLVLFVATAVLLYIVLAATDARNPAAAGASEPGTQIRPNDGV